MKQVDVLVNIFTIENEEVKILLIKKQTEPYKGYWMIPKTNANNDEDIKKTARNVLSKLGLKIPLYQNSVISDLERMPGLNILSISYVGFADAIMIKLKNEESPYEIGWFDVEKLPKLAYNNHEIINDNIEFLKEKLKKASVLNIFFPSDFSLPEIQRIYEKLYHIKFDRRNFRKKFLYYDLIEELEQKNEDNLGRPSNLYMFKEEYEDIDLF